ncbi:MAG: hypothetical protein M1829_004365 [Trizodia sp. TS-e1964]|nr:MAG: hypothetical protein M1829_004365 [Trizodia sp. TS-e1964]
MSDLSSSLEQEPPSPSHSRSHSHSHSSYSPNEPPKPPPPKKRVLHPNPKRESTVYDAVAGRVSASGFITAPFRSRYRDTLSSNQKVAAPEDILFRRRQAPQRYEENDIYFNPEPEGPLPDSDLLKTIHTYAADFYSKATQNKGETDWRSMDETAMLALGILLEETCLLSLGKTGDLVFTEGEGLGWKEESSLGTRPRGLGVLRRGRKKRRDPAAVDEERGSPMEVDGVEDRGDEDEEYDEEAEEYDQEVEEDVKEEPVAERPARGETNSRPKKSAKKTPRKTSSRESSRRKRRKTDEGVNS